MTGKFIEIGKATNAVRRDSNTGSTAGVVLGREV
jgi:hypothetical protein